jgi:heterotetrameric sarcosine oxidase gamma subunit
MTRVDGGSMPDRASPLATLVAASPDCAAARLEALPPATRLIIRGDATALAALGLPLPATCRAIACGDGSLLWLGPDEFLLIAADNNVPSGPNTIDVSHRDTALTVSGPRAAWVINAFCALDLHERAFPVGMCTRTVFGKAEIVLWRTAPDTFRIEVARSFAPYLWACLEAARREFVA